MPGVARIGDIGKTDVDSYIDPVTGSPIHPVTGTPLVFTGAGPIISGSVSVFVNNLGVARLNDIGTNAPGYPPGLPGIFTISGNCSETFFVDDKKVAYEGSETTHPGNIPNPVIVLPARPGIGSIQGPCSLDTFVG